jgi:hypothetical protein
MIVALLVLIFLAIIFPGFFRGIFKFAALFIGLAVILPMLDHKHDDQKQVYELAPTKIVEPYHPSGCYMTQPIDGKLSYMAQCTPSKATSYEQEQREAEEGECWSKYGTSCLTLRAIKTISQ